MPELHKQLDEKNYFMEQWIALFEENMELMTPCTCGIALNSITILENHRQKRPRSVPFPLARDVIGQPLLHVLQETIRSSMEHDIHVVQSVAKAS